MLNFVKNMLKKKRKTNLDDTAREASIQTRKAKAELRSIEFEIEKMKLQREKMMMEAKLNALEEKLFGSDDENDVESLVMGMLMSSLTKNPNIANALGSVAGVTSTTPPVTEPQLEPNGISLSDEVLKAYIASIPKKIIKQAKKLDDDSLRAFIIEKVPQASRDTIDRAIVLLRS